LIVLYLSMFRKSLALFLLSLGLHSSGFTQSVVSVTSVQGFPAILNIGQSYDLAVEVSYESGVAPVFVEDNLSINYLTDKMIENGNDAAQMGGPQEVSIPLGESLLLDVWDFDVIEEQFREGGNIVVIWPSYNGNVPNDSLMLELQTSESQGVTGLKNTSSLMRKFWTSSKIDREDFDALSIQNAWISDAMGNVICAIAVDRQWDSSAWPTGVYYLSFADYKGRMFTYKALKP
jgi:hypothetical protein